MSVRIVQIAAGAGRMYCGACMRENRLAAMLKQQGHDVVLLPLYMPMRTDETSISGRTIYYGGLSVGLQQVFAFFRQDHKRLDPLLDSSVVLRGLARLMARFHPIGLGPLTVSVLAGEKGEQHKELKKLIGGLSVLKPTLVSLPNLMFAGVARPLKKALNVPVLCTLAGEDAFLDALPAPYRARAYELIQEAAHDIDGFIAPTRYYASRAVEQFELDRDRVHYVPMGIRTDDIGEPADPPNDPPSNPFTIGYLAGICPEKGLAVLCEAFKRLTAENRRCRLKIAGYVGAAGRKYWARIRSGLRRQGLLGEVDFIGEVNRTEKLSFLRSLHVLSVPTVHPEPKGLYVLEAMASGVPVVQPRHGSFPELIDATQGGQLYDPNDPQGLADAIATLMEDESRRRRLAENGRAAVLAKFSDSVMAEETWSVYQRLI